MKTFCIGPTGLCPISGKSLVIFLLLNTDLNWSFSTFALSFELEINLSSTLRDPTPEESFLMRLTMDQSFLFPLSRLGSIKSSM